LIVPGKLLKSAENILSANLGLLGLNTKTSPSKLTISLTNKCNKECLTCNIWQISENGPPENELSLDEYVKLFKDLNGNGLIYLEFTGGEPYLRDDVDEIIIQAFQNISSLQFAAITTNGYNAEHIIRKTRKILQGIPPDCSLVLGVSIDGNQRLHDELKGKECSWDNAVETLNEAYTLQKEFSNLRPHVCYTINTYNAGKFKECHKSLDIPIDDFSFSVQHSGLLYNNKNTVTLDPEAIKKDLEYLKANPRRTASFDPESIFRSKSYESYMKGIIPFINGEKTIRCAALMLSGYLDPNGNVFSCIMWDKPVGNIRETGFNEIWESTISDETRLQIDSKECPGCWTPCEVQPSLLINIRKLMFG